MDGLWSPFFGLSALKRSVADACGALFVKRRVMINLGWDR
jgi:hypothetical protein